MKSNRLAIFDLDGTLLNTIGDLALGCNHMLQMRGLPEHTYEEYCHFVGNGITRLVERAIPQELRTAEYVAEARRDFVEYYTEHIDHKTVPYEGVHELLRHLSKERVTLAVASNKFHAGTERLIERFFPDVEFASVHGNRDGFPLKPDAAVLNLIMEECGVEPQQCCMIGDSGVDMQTAHNAGVRSIGVTWGFRSREELAENGAEHIVDSVDELLSAILL